MTNPTTLTPEQRAYRLDLVRKIIKQAKAHSCPVVSYSGKFAIACKPEEVRRVFTSDVLFALSGYKVAITARSIPVVYWSDLAWLLYREATESAS